MRAYTALILPELKELLAASDEALVRTCVEDLLPPDLVDICEHLEPDEAARLLTVLPLEDATEVLASLDPERQALMIEKIGRRRLVAMLDSMSPDDRADLMRRLPERSVEMLMPLLAQVERNDLKRLLSYPEQTAGALMTTEYVSLRAGLTVDEAMHKLRKVAPDSELIYYIYVVDDERRLQGVLSIRDIICALPRKTLGEIMTQHPVAVTPETDQEEIARLFERYDLQAIPVVEADTKKLLGIVTFDDVIDVIEDEATEDLQRMGGVEPLHDSYMRSSVPHLVRKRVVWLALLLGAQSFTALAIQHYEGLLHAAVMLVPFIPLVNSQGGNAGSQSATLVTRALATGDLEVRDALRVIAKEALSGLLLGVSMAVVALGLVMLLGSEPITMVIVGTSICAVVVIGSILGTLIPLGLHQLGLDPAVASAPFIASLSDVLGIAVYFTLARAMLSN